MGKNTDCIVGSAFFSSQKCYYNYIDSLSSAFSASHILDRVQIFSTHASIHGDSSGCAFALFAH